MSHRHSNLKFVDLWECIIALSCHHHHLTWKRFETSTFYWTVLKTIFSIIHSIIDTINDYSIVYRWDFWDNLPSSRICCCDRPSENLILHRVGKHTPTPTLWPFVSVAPASWLQHHQRSQRSTRHDPGSPAGGPVSLGPIRGARARQHGSQNPLHHPKRREPHRRLYDSGEEEGRLQGLSADTKTLACVGGHLDRVLRFMKAVSDASVAALWQLAQLYDMLIVEDDPYYFLQFEKVSSFVCALLFLFGWKWVANPWMKPTRRRVSSCGSRGLPPFCPWMWTVGSSGPTPSLRSCRQGEHLIDSLLHLFDW